MSRQHQISPDVLNVLADAEISGKSLRITRQLDRTLYVDVNKVLDALGGKWNRSAKAHLFEGDAADLVDEVVLTGTYSRSKQDFGAFYTPVSLAEQMAVTADIQENMVVLEPSAGDGRLASAAQRMAPGVILRCYEINPKSVERLHDQNFAATCGNFLDVLVPFAEVDKVDRVVMNPPFAKRADIHHIRHAFRFLKSGGILVAIASASVKFRDDKLARDFRGFVSAHDGYIHDLPEGSFKEAGTMVNTVMLHMRKPL